MRKSRNFILYGRVHLHWHLHYARNGVRKKKRFDFYLLHEACVHYKSQHVFTRISHLLPRELSLTAFSYLFDCTYVYIRHTVRVRRSPFASPLKYTFLVRSVGTTVMRNILYDHLLNRLSPSPRLVLPPYVAAVRLLTGIRIFFLNNYPITLYRIPYGKVYCVHKTSVIKDSKKTHLRITRVLLRNRKL